MWVDFCLYVVLFSSIFIIDNYWYILQMCACFSGHFTYFNCCKFKQVFYYYKENGKHFHFMLKNNITNVWVNSENSFKNVFVLMYIYNKYQNLHFICKKILGIFVYFKFIKNKHVKFQSIKHLFVKVFKMNNNERKLNKKQQQNWKDTLLHFHWQIIESNKINLSSYDFTDTETKIVYLNISPNP